jgi:hypothetical protein
VEQEMKQSNIIIHYGASTWTAKVRDGTGKFVEFDLRIMSTREQNTFRKELTKAFREAGLQ